MNFRVCSSHVLSVRKCIQIYRLWAFIYLALDVMTSTASTSPYDINDLKTFISLFKSAQGRWSLCRSVTLANEIYRPQGSFS